MKHVDNFKHIQKHHIDNAHKRFANGIGNKLLVLFDMSERFVANGSIPL